MSKVYILGVPGAKPRLEDVVQVAKGELLSGMLVEM